MQLFCVKGLVFLKLVQGLIFCFVFGDVCICKFFEKGFRVSACVVVFGCVCFIVYLN